MCHKAQRKEAFLEIIFIGFHFLKMFVDDDVLCVLCMEVRGSLPLHLHILLV